MFRIVADWNRLLSLLVLITWLAVAAANRSFGVGFFSWAFMSFAFIWWTDEMADAVRVPRAMLRIASWTILLLPLIAGLISASVNSDLLPGAWDKGSR